MTRNLRALALAPFALLRDLLDAVAGWADRIDTRLASALNPGDGDE